MTASRLAASPTVRNIVVLLLMLAVIGIAAVALGHILRETSWSDIRDAIARIGTGRLVAALGLTVLSYIVLTAYDVVALTIIDRQVPYPRAALASFTSYIFSHNFGFAALTGGTARLRIYRPAGLTIGEVAQITVMAGLAFWLGVLLLFAIGLLLHPGIFAAEGVRLSYPVQATIGAMVLVALIGYLVLLHYRAGRPVRLFGWSFTLPGVRVALVQFAIGALDLTVATAVLFVLLPDAAITLFPEVLLAYLLGLVSGLITHSPGGVGVFEVVVLLALPQVDRTTLFGALLVYRAVYFLLPLAVGLALFGAHELRYWRRPSGRPPAAQGTDA